MEAIGTLAGGIAHDFNNILAAISAYVELVLMDDIPLEGDTRECLEQALQGVDRAKGLVSQILAFSRTSKRQHGPVRLNAVVEDVLKMLRATIPTTIDIQTRIDDEQILSLGDPIQIHQVLMNLCTNAAQAMRQRGGILKVRLEQAQISSDEAIQHQDLEEGTYARITVSDTGVGMNQETLERVFDPFFTTKPKGEGTGMGLAVVHGIVKNHSGCIIVSSEPDKGAVFQVYIPVLAEAVEMAPEDVPPELLHGKGEKILFVDDERDIVDSKENLLSRLGYKVVARLNGSDALEAFRADGEAFDVVITDQTMPGLTGGELAREILKLKPDTPIILCTGYSETFTEAQAEELGIRKFLMKPVEAGTLAEAIRQVL